jgi:hypothetical protein
MFRFISSGSKKKEPSYACLSEAKASHSGNVGHRQKFVAAVCAQNGPCILTGMLFSNFILYVYETDN